MVNRLKNIKFPEEMLQTIRVESNKLGLNDSAYVRLAVAKYSEVKQ